jgi:hypothetical protein
VPRQNNPSHPTAPKPDLDPASRGHGRATPLTKVILSGFAAVHAVLAVLFVIASLALIAITVRTAWNVVTGGLDGEVAQEIIQMIGVAAIAVVALQIAQTITEEEVIRDAQISAPTRVRRFVSRFFAVVVVALAIEGLVAVFKAVREDLASLTYAAAVVLAAAALLAAWGVFVRLNRSAEELEPEAMREAKREDSKLK